MKILGFIILAVLNISTSLNINCNYGGRKYWVAGTIYSCELETTTIVSSEGTIIESASGNHENSKDNQSVLGLKVERATIQYLPYGLVKIFNNLKLFWIEKCHMKEIRQRDLRQYPNLEYLFLGNNDIEIIEEDLFKFNLKLKAISFWNCKVFHIDPNVFNNLPKLKELWLKSNRCIDMKSDQSSIPVSNVMKEARNNCQSSEYLNLQEKFENFEDESEKLSKAEIYEKLEKLTEEFKSSKFSKFPSLARRIKELRNQNIPNVCQADQHLALNMKINDIESNLKELIVETSDDLIAFKNLQNRELSVMKEKIEELSNSQAEILRIIETINN